MIRGTTPTLEFTLPFDTILLAEAWVTLSQNGSEIVTKTLQECSCEGEMLTVRLAQEDTLKLRSDNNTEIQIRARTHEGNALASNIITASTARILKDGVI